GNYINDLMESFLHRLVSAQDWTRIITAYRIIKDTNDYGLKAGFAWVIARAIQEGYLSQANMSAAAQIINSQTAGSDDFFHLAYNAGDVFLIPALYYRVQSAKALDLPVLIFPDNPDNESATDTELLRFILGFFENGAADFSIPYIRFHENSMSPDELRETASALDEAENYPQSIRVVSLYVNNEGYQRTRRDIELMYPRPHLELVETRAQALNTAPSLLYGLIRTESAFQSAVISHAGAVGLMQLMPDTARDMADRIRRTGGPNFFGENNVIDSTDVFTNVYIGAYYYNYLFNRFNNEQLALMSYNGGMTRVQRWVNASSLPADLLVETVTIYETRDFGRRVPAAGRVYQELYY
ncbi:MAG: lytic transglycosylase domain-containing protein, partial [Treponema sp.]|nr:lytic transglycosylase domain-containing protein [Treponema sp.]